MRTEMRSFSERSPYKVGAVGVALTIAAVLIGLLWHSLPFVNQNTEYTAYFAELGGLTTGAPVQVSGARVGSVTGVDFDGSKIVITFDAAKGIRLGDRTEAAVKTESLLGSKFLEITPRGEGQLRQPIPLDRTTPAYQLPDALGDVTRTIARLDTDQLSQSLQTLSETFKDTPPDFRVAVEGLGRFSQSLDKRDGELRKLLANANKATAVLAKRSDQVVGLIGNTNALLSELRTQSDALDSLSGNLSALSQQLSGFVADNRSELAPALDKLNGVLTIVSNRRERVQQSLKGLNNLALSLGESVSSGPFFNAYLANLLPGQFLQPFIDAAFSDLGLDPNVLLPSQLTDPPTGQPGTPAMPSPYPRTGQGGQPRLTVPDAITGNLGDQQCGAPGLQLPGPGCYPYREPPPAPPPGGPPPGPPIPVQPAQQPTPTPLPVYEPAPGEAPPVAQDTP